MINTKELTKETTVLSTTVYDLEVSTREDYRVAENLTKDCIALEKKVKEFFEPSKKSAHDTHKKIIAMEKEQLEPLAKMKAFLKSKMTGYIEVENAYTDGVNAYLTAVKTGEVGLEFAEDEDLLKLVEYAKAKARLGRSEVVPQDYLADALETLKGMERLTGFKEEIKAQDTGLKKLSTFYSIESIDVNVLLKAIADGRALDEWVQPNESEILSSAKGKETQEEVDKVFKDTGIKVVVEKRVR
jgi:hypothetical protein